MMIGNIRQNILQNKGKKTTLKVNNIRNKEETFKGIIKEVYQRVFIVECADGLERSFSFVDILTGTVEIIKKY